jgi:hypothetical protein
MTGAVDYVRLALLSLILLLWAVPAYAGTVAIVRPPGETPDLTEALSRIHGELLSVGLEVKVIERPAERGLQQTDLRAWLEEVAIQGQIDAVIDIVGDTAPVAVDVWVIEKAPRRLEVSRIALEPNTRNASETLAIRAVEVLRSTFLEKDMDARERRSLPVAKPKSTPTSSSTSFPRGDLQKKQQSRVDQFGVEAGAATLTSLDGVGFAIMPIAQLDWRARSWFMVQAALAGLGTRPTASTTDGSAHIAQQYGTLGGVYRPYSERLFWPQFALSAGVFHTSIEGQAASPMQAHDADRWSFLLDAGLGAGLRLSDRYYLTLAAHVQVAEPYVAIHIVDAVVATTGRPNLAITLTIGAWL